MTNDPKILEIFKRIVGREIKGTEFDFRVLGIISATVSVLRDMGKLK